jgi:DNA polymerase III subunit gamma/tau
VKSPQPPELSLYRRHRPRTFEDVVGQEPVVRTLRNAVERGKVHHAYLFVGSRGTGKTSMAKILAACLNCEQGPTTQPCGQCDSCQSIARASSLDVIEMDAASNNSVDDIRELRESVAYAPVSGRRKVYILDEAHMLSTAAWNAFLKTLEEPPANTVFVLATTEAQKVPPTVIDRCHRFDFHRPTVEQIAAVVDRTAKAEGITIPPEAVAALARAATGSFRDALGTLEQLLTYSGNEIALADVLAVLGVADSQLLRQTVDAVAAEDARAALRALADYVEQGRDPSSFARDLEVRCRELLVVQTLGEVPAELALTPDADADLKAQSERVAAQVIVRLLEGLGAALEAVRAGADPRTRLELALVKAATPEVDPSARALLARLERLESSLAGSGAERAASEPARPEQVPGGAVGPGAGGEASDEGPPAAAEGGSQGPPGDPPASSAADGPRVAAGGESAHAPPPSGGGSGISDLDSVRAVWPAVVEAVRGRHGMLGAAIQETEPVALQDGQLTVAFGSNDVFLMKKADVAANRTIVADALHEVAGGRWRLDYELRSELDARRSQGGPRTEQEWVARFMEEFDAEEVAVHIPAGQPAPSGEGVEEG